MRLLAGTIIVLMTTCIRPVLGGTASSAGSESSPDSMPICRALEADVAEDDIRLHSEQFRALIYYGMNGSHSRGWVQVDNGGAVGISVFERFPDSPSEGILSYRTVGPDGSRNTDTITTGSRLEKTVLLYDDADRPHIFVATSDTSTQMISRYTKDDSGQWSCDTLTQFHNEAGKFIYEISADKGPDDSFHILMLITRSDIDSDDFWDAWQGCQIYLLDNAEGYWWAKQVRWYDMPYTADHYIKSSSRQDLKVDADGYVHIVIGEQVGEASRLLYITDKYGSWQTEVVLNYDYETRDDAGWFPSLCLDHAGVPHVSCMYVHRYPAGSAISSKLVFVRRVGPDNWVSETVADTDDGYYGTDGRAFTGGMSHLVFDHNDAPHIIFSDIASSHWNGINHLNAGNIRLAVYRDGAWDVTTVYRQPLPDGFFDATEMHGMCLAMSAGSDTIRVIGQELEIFDTANYTCRLIDFSWGKTPTYVEESTTHLPSSMLFVSPIFPNPLNSSATIQFSLRARAKITATVYNLLGQRVTTLVDGELGAGEHSLFWSGTDNRGEPVSSGVYFCRFRVKDQVETRKILLTR
jgi:hypothetical protein